ncbi:MAG: McrC family protein [Thermanaerothrix sp.]|uniref:McrC family protein n=1 Tax=Thermanaerothrix sp. TaxID=2972675 RepID=UPI003C7D9FA9
MQPVVTLFEHQRVSYAELGLDANASILQVLDRLNAQSKTDLIVLERTALRTTQYVGILEVPGLTLQILPKIDYEPPTGNLSIEESAIRNFLLLLLYAQDIRLHQQTLASLRTARGPWLEMMIHLFATELQTQIQQGLHQDYQWCEDSLPYLRGRWNITRQFSHRPNIHQGLEVTYEDYTLDTPLNRFFRWTTHTLRRLSYQPENRRLLAYLEDWLLPVHLPPHLSVYEVERIGFNRLNERFRPAYELALLYLKGLTEQLLPGTQRLLAFVFDMNRLFEAFVTNLILKHQQYLLPPAWQNTKIYVQGGPTIHHLAKVESSGSPLFRLKPDIIIGDLVQPLLIIDTKNKVLSGSNYAAGVEEEDIYQMVTYALHFRCPHVLLLYPRPKGENNVIPPVSLQIEGQDIRVFVATLDLHQPLDPIDPILRDMRKIFDYFATIERRPQEVY